MPRTYGTTNAAPYAAAPPVGAAGDTYFNTTSKTMFLSDGTNWLGVSSGGGAGSAAPYIWVAYGGSTGGTGPSYVPITWGTVMGSAGFTTPPGVALSPQTAGRYEISGEVTVTSGVAQNYCVARVEYFSSASVLINTYLFTGDGFGANGMGVAPFALVLDMGVGEYVRISGSVASGAFNLEQRSSAVVIAATGGTGAKGDTGAVGPAGTPTSDGFTRYSAAGADIPLGASQVMLVPLATLGESAGSTYTSNGANTQFTIPATGVYDMTGHISGNAAGFTTGTIVGIAVNGNILARTTCEAVTAYSSLTISIQRYLNAGDQVSLVAIGSTATNIRYNATNSTTDARQPYLSVWRAGAGLQGAQGVPGTSGSATAVPPPYYSVRRASNPTSAQNVFTQVMFDTVIDSNTGSTDFTFASGAITVVAAGYYQIVGQVYAQNVGTGNITIAFWTGSQWSIGAAQAVPGGTSGVGLCEVMWETWLAAGTQVALLLLSNAASPSWGSSTLQTTNMPYNPSLSIVKAGGAKGDPGAAGAAGIQGPAGTTTQALVARGEWTSAAAYNPLEIVTRNGVAFLAMNANSNVDPGSLPAGSFAPLADIQAQVTAVGRNLPWTPIFRQPSTPISCTVSAGWYSRVGEWVIGEFDVRFTGAGTAATLVMDLPVPMRAPVVSTDPINIGTAYLFTGANTYSILYTQQGNNTQVAFAVGANYWSTAIASGHQATGYFMYLAPVGV